MQRRLDAVGALLVGALADELDLGKGEALGGFGDPLVDVAEQRLDACNALFGGFMSVSRNANE